MAVISRASRCLRGQRADDRASRVWAIYGCLGVCLVAYLVSEIVRRNGQSWPWLDGWGVSAFEILASALCLVRALVSRNGRLVSLMLGLGLVSWSIGDAVLTMESVGGANPPTPSLADAFYLSFYPLTYVALMLLVRREVRKFGVAEWLDGAVAGLGAAAVCAAFAFHDVLHSAGGNVAAVATNLSYPVGDLLLLALVVAGTAVLPGRKKAPWLLLAAGYTINTVGDTFNLFQSGIGATHVGTLFNAVAWPTSILLVSAAVWVRSSPSIPLTRDERTTLLLPGLAISASLGILLVGCLHHTGRVALALAAATMVTAGVRFALSLVSLRTLTEERRWQAVTDQLTGLGNRRALFQLLDSFIPEGTDPAQADRKLAFLYVDLDHFKEVNDSFGHAVGDELLSQLGARLQGSLRSSDLVVRLGGDEFGVALIDANTDYAATVAARLTTKLEEPFSIGVVRARIGASIGIAVFPSDATEGDDLLRCADLAMYRAKLAGAGFAIYSEDLDGAGNRVRLLEELRSAIEHRRLELHYQPLVDLSSGEVAAVEALLRWPHPRLGLVPPLEFLPLAEEAELMGPLTALVLDEALTQCAQWRSEGCCLAVSINISSTNLLDPAFTELVAQLLARHRLPPEALVLEVTETTAIADFERAQTAIKRLRDLELVVSVDDFGAGFTSLAYLSNLAVGELKLDRSFITGLASAQGRELALVRATVGLAHALGLRVVAEGIEDQASLDLLRAIGCDRAQGYYLSRPKPADQLELPKETARAAA